MCVVVSSGDAADVKDSAEKVKQALDEAQKAQTTAASAIQQATADIRTANRLLSTVGHNNLPDVTGFNSSSTSGLDEQEVRVNEAVRLVYKFEYRDHTNALLKAKTFTFLIY